MKNIPQSGKSKLASLSLSTLSIIVGENGDVSYQLVIAPSSAEFPKRTVSFDAVDAPQLALELGIMARILQADRNVS